MINPLEKMREGIRTDSMDLVKEGFEEFTGEKFLDEPEPEPEKCAEPSRGSENFIVTPKDRASKKARIARTEKIQAGSNTFLDDGSEASEVSTPDINLTKRTRTPAKTVGVECHLCGKTEEISAKLIQGEFYRCEKCSRR